jgi:hypothetical protein
MSNTSQSNRKTTAMATNKTSPTVQAIDLLARGFMFTSPGRVRTTAANQSN